MNNRPICLVSYLCYRDCSSNIKLNLLMMCNLIKKILPVNIYIKPVFYVIIDEYHQLIINIVKIVDNLFPTTKIITVCRFFR